MAKAKIEEGKWQKIGAAAGVIGVLVALYFGLRTLSPSPGPSPSGPTSTDSSTQQSSGSPSSTSPVSPGPTSKSAGRAGTEVNSATVTIANGNSLSYQTGAGSEVIFTYYGSLGDLDAGTDVNLAILNGPAPAPNSAYRACEDLSSNSYTQEVKIDTISAGETLCAFTANSQLTWVQFLGTSQPALDPSGPYLKVAAMTWQIPRS